MKNVKTCLQFARSPKTEAVTSEVLGCAFKCGHEGNETDGGLETLTWGPEPRGTVL